MFDAPRAGAEILGPEGSSVQKYPHLCPPRGRNTPGLGALGAFMGHYFRLRGGRCRMLPHGATAVTHWVAFGYAKMPLGLGPECRDFGPQNCR